jgi:hypothetical protein
MSLSRKDEAKLARGNLDAILTIAQTIISAANSTREQIEAAVGVRNSVRANRAHKPCVMMDEILQRRFEKSILTL